MVSSFQNSLNVQCIGELYENKPVWGIWETDKKNITSSVYDCTVEDVEYIYNKFSLYTEFTID